MLRLPIYRVVVSREVPVMRLHRVAPVARRIGVFGGVVCVAGMLTASAVGGDGATCTTWDVTPGQPGLLHPVPALHVLVDAESRAAMLMAGSEYTFEGHAPETAISWWTGSSWAAMGDAMPLATVTNMVSFDAGTGSAFYALGAPFDPGATSVARWDGRAWSAVAGAPVSWIGGAGVFESNGVRELYVSGGFSVATPDGLASYVARWDGEVWRAVGDPGSAAHDMLVWDDGSGPSLFGGGSIVFDTPDGSCSGLGRWDGAAWNAVGSCDFLLVSTLALHDDGRGEAMYIGGIFQQAGGAPAQNIARWDGSAWTALGGGVQGQVHAIASFDDGCGTALYVAGDFTMAGEVPVNNMAPWDGTSWSAVGGGANGPVLALLAIDADAGGPALVVAGDFTEIDGMPANRVAFLRLAPVPGDLNGDGAVNIADLLILLAAWGPCEDGAPCAADIDGDGVVDLADLLVMLMWWEG